jgi:Mn2+/Fe2+ NRAMP family transporter
MLRPLPYPIVIEFLVLGVALVVMGLYLVIRGTLPRWLPSGYVDQAGNRAEFSQPVYRLIGVTSALAGGACPLLALSQRLAIVVLAFVLIAIGFLFAIPSVVLAGREQSERSLRRKRSTEIWSWLAFIIVMALNGLVIYSALPNSQG